MLIWAGRWALMFWVIWLGLWALFGLIWVTVLLPLSAMVGHAAVFGTGPQSQTTTVLEIYSWVSFVVAALGAVPLPAIIWDKWHE